MLDFKTISDKINLPEGYIIRDISSESVRIITTKDQEYEIVNPIAIIMRNGGSTHRIVDAQGWTHCVPSPTNGGISKWFSDNFVVF